MTLLAIILWILFGTAIFTSFIWLVIVAFRQSVLWGFLVLFLSPFTAVIFAIKNWSEAKKPFLIHIISISGFVSLLFYLLIGLGGLQMLEGIYEVTRKGMSQKEKGGKLDQLLGQIENSNALPSEGKEKLAKLRLILEELKAIQFNKGRTDQKRNPSGQAREDQTVFSNPSAENYKNRAGKGNPTIDKIKKLFMENKGTLEEVSLNEVPKLIGETFKVKGKDGLVIEGELTEIRKKILVFKKASDQGSFQLELGFDEIASLQVYR